MENLKQEVLDTIANLPDAVTIDDIMYRLYVLDKVKKAQEAVERGEVMRLEDLKKEMHSW